MKKKIFIPVIALLFALLGGSAVASYYFYDQLGKTQAELVTIKNDPEALRAVLQDDSQQLIQKVRGLMDLPEDEEPVVATVTDIEKLRGQEFFTRAKNGDRVLIYGSVKKAILYDPVAHKIIDVAPINIGTPSGQVAGESVVPDENDGQDEQPDESEQ